MPNQTSSRSIRRVIKSVRAAHRRSSELWIQRMEDPAQRAPGRR
jgi:hypothetical protein